MSYSINAEKNYSKNYFNFIFSLCSGRSTVAGERFTKLSFCKGGNGAVTIRGTNQKRVPISRPERKINHPISDNIGEFLVIQSISIPTLSQIRIMKNSLFTNVIHRPK